ncbi:hypothetical protein LV779_36715 [Streptomyces thinghirensis]|nr:hypothetical protein [Streptomyces thinghirensis]
MLHGRSYLVPTPDEAASYSCTASEQQVLGRWTNSVLHGIPTRSPRTSTACRGSLPRRDHG